MSNIKKLVHGVGINDGIIPTYKNGKRLKEYEIWKSLLARCYSEYKHQIQPTYKDCIVSENFKNYSYFYEWCQNQTFFNKNNYELDKDILIRNNKIYHEDLCVFVPKFINSLFVNSKAKRGLHPIGVTWHSREKLFYSRITRYGIRHTIGRYTSSDEAFYNYKIQKELYIKDVANEYKSKIDEKVYLSLINYEIGIND